MGKSDTASSIRIHRGNLSQEEVDALRRLLGLLARHLKHEWVLVNGDAEADLVLVNVDASPLDGYRHLGVVVGCSLKPSRQQGATLHRPFRSYELLAILSDLTPKRVDKSASGQGGAKAAPASPVWRYRLRLWPLEFEQWPRDWWPIMACILRQHRSSAEISLRTGAQHSVVEVCLAELSRHDYLDRAEERRTLPRVEPESLNRWTRLATRVGQILGFSR